MIFPLKDSTPRIYTPYMTWCLIACSFGVFFFQLSLSDSEFYQHILSYGLIPSALWGEEGSFGSIRLLSYTFLHSNWAHIIANMWTVWIFADNIEDITGPWRFLLFYLLCGVAAGLVHGLVYASSGVPVVGASGAVSGVLGAYFLLYPRARITTFVFFLIIDLPASIYLGSWFIMQLVAGLSGSGVANIAWWAHLGGFVAGVVLVPFFRGGRDIPRVLPVKAVEKAPRNPTDPWDTLRSK